MTGEPLPVSLSGLEREYVWGPGDNGLDEILVQYDIERKAFWMIQDGGGDVVAMCDLQGSGGTARVVKSWQYDAYGQCLRATDVVATSSSYSIPINRVGHKGLFMDRLDVGLANGNLADNPRLAPFSTVLYQNRNRTYSPQLGRFIQRDPNESGQLLAAMQGFMGSTPTGSGDTFGLAALYADGGSLLAYLCSSPLPGEDAFGCEFTLKGMLISGAISAGIGGLSNAFVARVYKGKTWGETAMAGLKGAVAGFVGGMIGYSIGAAFQSIYAIGIVGGAGGGAGSGFTSGLWNMAFEGGTFREALEDAAWGAAIGTMSGLMGSYIFAKDAMKTPYSAQFDEVLEPLYTEFLDVYWAAAAAGFGAMADEVRKP